MDDSIRGDEKTGVEVIFDRLKPAMKRIDLRTLRGGKVALDAHSFLFKGAIQNDCYKKLCKKEETDGHIDYCIEMARKLESYGVEVMFIFHGKKLGLQAKYEKILARERGHNLWRGEYYDTLRYYRKALAITREIKFQLMQALRANNIEYMVAPFDAGAQLTFHMAQNLVQAVISDDFNLIPFGCKRVIYKMNISGFGYDFQMSKILGQMHPECSLDLTGFTQDTLREMCVLSSCKYFCIPPDVSWTYELFSRYKTARGIKEIASDKWTPSGYLSTDSSFADFSNAVIAYKHHKVFDSSLRRVTHLNKLPANFPKESLNILGSYIPNANIRRIVDGTFYHDEQEESNSSGGTRARQPWYDDDDYVATFNFNVEDGYFSSGSSSTDSSEL